MWANCRVRWCSCGWSCQDLNGSLSVRVHGASSPRRTCFLLSRVDVKLRSVQLVIHSARLVKLARQLVLANDLEKKNSSPNEIVMLYLNSDTF